MLIPTKKKDPWSEMVTENEETCFQRQALMFEAMQYKDRNAETKKIWNKITRHLCQCSPHYCYCGARAPSKVPLSDLESFIEEVETYNNSPIEISQLQREAAENVPSKVLAEYLEEFENSNYLEV